MSARSSGHRGMLTEIREQIGLEVKTAKQAAKERGWINGNIRFDHNR